jgi:hypothetical protein
LAGKFSIIYGFAPSELIEVTILMDHKHQTFKKKSIISKIAGIWKDSDDVIDFEKTRNSWDCRNNPAYSQKKSVL